MCTCAYARTNVHTHTHAHTHAHTHTHTHTYTHAHTHRHDGLALVSLTYLLHRLSNSYFIIDCHDGDYHCIWSQGSLQFLQQKQLF